MKWKFLNIKLGLWQLFWWYTKGYLNVWDIYATPPGLHNVLQYLPTAYAVGYDCVAPNGA